MPSRKPLIELSHIAKIQKLGSAKIIERTNKQFEVLDVPKAPLEHLFANDFIMQFKDAHTRFVIEIFNKRNKNQVDFFNRMIGKSVTENNFDAMRNVYIKHAETAIGCYLTEMNYLLKIRKIASWCKQSPRIAGSIHIWDEMLLNFENHLAHLVSGKILVEKLDKKESNTGTLQNVITIEAASSHISDLLNPKSRIPDNKMMLEEQILTLQAHEETLNKKIRVLDTSKKIPALFMKLLKNELVDTKTMIKSMQEADKLLDDWPDNAGKA